MLTSYWLSMPPPPTPRCNNRPSTACSRSWWSNCPAFLWCMARPGTSIAPVILRVGPTRIAPMPLRRLSPGDPAGALMARFQGRMTPQAIHSLELQFGISHDPLWMQYFQYLNNLIHGDMGTSFTYFPTPVLTVLVQELPWTLTLVGTSVLISFMLGSLIGVLI